VKGDDAVYKSAHVGKGNFQIDFEGRSSEQTITRSTQGLMMKAFAFWMNRAAMGKERLLETGRKPGRCPLDS